MIKKTILLIILLCLIGFETKADSENCPTSISYNGSTKQFTFYYSGGIPKDGNGESLYTRIELEISKGKGSGHTWFVNIKSKTSNNIITDNSNGNLDSTSEMISTQKSDGSWSNKDKLTYFNGSKDLNSYNSTDKRYLNHCYYNGVLPIKLISFTYDNYIFTWETASELNNKWFILQSSSDGKSWVNEEYIYSKGNSNQIVNYSLVFKPIYQYYRLVQEDWDGQFEIFLPIHINLNISEERIFDLQLNELPNNFSLKPGTIYLSLKNNKWTKIMK